MNPESKRALIAVVRRIVFAGLIILGAWLALTIIRGAIPASVIELLASDTHISVDAWSEIVYESDWSVSFWTNEPVSEVISERLEYTLKLVVFAGLLSLAIASVLLFLGVLISRVTEQAGRLVKVRSILRLILISRGVTNPVFWVATLFIVYQTIWGSMPTNIPSPSWWPPSWREVYFVSLVPAWLLVQAGHGELGKLNGSYGFLARHLAIRLVITLLKLVGAIIAISVLVGSGLGRLMVSAAIQRDLPVAFGVAWVFVIMVVLVKLVAELIEIAYNHFGHLPESSDGTEEAARPVRIPKGWLVFSLALVLLSVVVAVVGPAFAPYESNEISLADRMVQPSAEHIMGTDNVGRDIFSRLLYGIRTDISAGLLSAGILAVIATGWAILAAYFKKADSWLGDTLEDVVMLPRDVICAFPWLVLLLLLISIFDPGLLQAALLGGLVVLLPRAVGMMREAYSSPPVGRGWLHSVLWSIPVMFLLAVAEGILYTSSLSYLGFGIPPPIPELGGMLSGAGRQFIMEAPWMALWPGIFLAFLSFVWVMAGDALLERLGFRTKSLWLKVME
ncbi:hypothetical protein ACFLU1_03830 [Chloroflexota bacterium]